MKSDNLQEDFAPFGDLRQALWRRRSMAKPSRRFFTIPILFHTNLRDVVLAGMVARVERLRGAYLSCVE